MTLNLDREVAALRRMTVPQLRRRYADVFGEATCAGNRDWLVKRIAWRLQAREQGDLSERARQRAAEIANDADLRSTAPRARPVPIAPPTFEADVPARHDQRLPPPGTILRRPYKGRVVEVQILDHGFLLDGEVHPSLSAVAKAVTGTPCNGFLFFRLGKHGASP